MAKSEFAKLFNYFSRFVYALAGMALMVASLLITVKCLGDIYHALPQISSSTNNIQDGVGLLFIATIVFAVSQHLLLKTMLWPRTSQVDDNSRQILKKFIWILILYVTLAALMSLITFMH